QERPAVVEQAEAVTTVAERQDRASGPEVLVAGGDAEIGALDPGGEGEVLGLQARRAADRHRVAGVGEVERLPALSRDVTGAADERAVVARQRIDRIAVGRPR